jgi:hypothetical protein
MLSIVLDFIIAKQFENFVFPSSAWKEEEHNLILVGPYEIPELCSGSTEIGPLSLFFST